MKIKTVNEYLKELYGEKIYKIAIDGGFTCPNRDGTKGKGGCIFCAADGSGAYAQSSKLTVTEQIEKGKKLVEAKLGNGKHRYIAYFQNFTGTYDKVGRLESLYMEAAGHPDIAIVSIATRPDCIDNDVLELLKKVNRIKPVWVELGLQTVHEATAKLINRCYDLEVYDTTVKELRKNHIEVITHVILGLPGEDINMMKETVKHVCEQGSNGIKLQLLHVLKGTKLAEMYEEGKLSVMTQEEYIYAVTECLKIIPKDMIIHRITGDGDRKQLIAPLWSLDKKKVLNSLNKAIEEM